MEPKMSVNFGRYSREFVIAVIVITEFDCILFSEGQIQLIDVGLKNEN